MNKIYIVIDRTAQGIRKPFVKICKTSTGAQNTVKAMQAKLKSHAHHLVTFEPVEVMDYDR